MTNVDESDIKSVLIHLRNAKTALKNAKSHKDISQRAYREGELLKALGELTTSLESIELWNR